MKSAWWDYLQVRHVMIHEWADEGKSPEEIVALLATDPVQIRLLLMTPLTGPKQPQRGGGR